MQCSSTNWLSDSSVRCITPKTGEGVHDVHYLAGGAFQESSFESPVAALQKALSPDGIVQVCARARTPEVLALPKRSFVCEGAHTQTKSARERDVNGTNARMRFCACL